MCALAAGEDRDVFLPEATGANALEPRVEDWARPLRVRAGDHDVATRFCNSTRLRGFVTFGCVTLSHICNSFSADWSPYLAAGFGVVLGEVVALALRNLDRHLQIRRWPVTRTLRDASPGVVVRIVGKVVSDETVIAPAETAPVAYARTVFPIIGADGRACGNFQEDVRGVPFGLALDGGDVVHLDPTQVELFESPPAVTVTTETRKAMGAAWRAWWGRPWAVRQDVLRPGDRIEAVGRLEVEVRPDGHATPGRGTPVRATLLPLASGKIWVRKCDD